MQPPALVVKHPPQTVMYFFLAICLSMGLLFQNSNQASPLLLALMSSHIHWTKLLAMCFFLQLWLSAAQRNCWNNLMQSTEKYLLQCPPPPQHDYSGHFNATLWKEGKVIKTSWTHLNCQDRSTADRKIVFKCLPHLVHNDNVMLPSERDFGNAMCVVSGRLAFSIVSCNSSAQQMHS